MCAYYESPLDKTLLKKKHFSIDLPSELAMRDVWPGYKSTFIRRRPQADVGDDALPPREALLGSFGLIPHWSKDDKIARHTFNARSETVAEKPSFRDAWRRAQHGIIPAQFFFEPHWRGGKAVPTRITLSSGEPMGLAGLWAQWRSSFRCNPSLKPADEAARSCRHHSELKPLSLYRPGTRGYTLISDRFQFRLEKFPLA
jgi:putative SOS response-associated peptidase YedK